MQRVEHDVGEAHDAAEISAAHQWQQLDLLTRRQTARLHPCLQPVDKRPPLPRRGGGEEYKHRIIVPSQHFEEQRVGFRMNLVQRLRTQIKPLVWGEPETSACGLFDVRGRAVASSEPGQHCQLFPIVRRALFRFHIGT